MPGELDESDMEKLVQKIREKICFLLVLMGISMVTKHRFTLQPKRYYCTFYRSDIDPPEKGIAKSKVSKKLERKQRVILLQLPINLNDATTATNCKVSQRKNLL